MGSALLVGYPYRAKLFLATGRYGFCKVSGRPGEGLWPGSFRRWSCRGPAAASQDRGPPA